MWYYWRPYGWRQTMVNKPWHKLTWSKAPGELTIEDLQDGCCVCHRGYRKKCFQQFWISMSPQCLPPSFGSVWLIILKQMKFEDFQDGHLEDHLRYQTTTILAILNLNVTQMPPIKFGLHPHYSLGGDIFWRISRGPAWRSSWKSEWKEFSSSESPCLQNASHQVSA